MIDGVSLNRGAASTPAQPRSLAEAANQFEAILICELLKGVRESESGSWMGSERDGASDSAMGFAEEHLSRVLASQGGLGIASVVMKQEAQAAPKPPMPSVQKPGSLPGN